MCIFIYPSPKSNTSPENQVGRCKFILKMVPFLKRKLLHLGGGGGGMEYFVCTTGTAPNDLPMFKGQQSPKTKALKVQAKPRGFHKGFPGTESGRRPSPGWDTWDTWCGQWGGVGLHRNRLKHGVMAEALPKWPKINGGNWGVKNQTILIGGSSDVSKYS